jgi:hypothetical protein
MAQQPLGGQGFTITLVMTPLDERSVRHRDLCLTTHNTHNRQTSMPLAVFRSANPASGCPQTHALHRAGTCDRHNVLLVGIIYKQPINRLLRQLRARKLLSEQSSILQVFTSKISQFMLGCKFREPTYNSHHYPSNQLRQGPRKTDITLNCTVWWPSQLRVSF